MVAFIVKKVIEAIIVLFIVSCIAFAVKYSFGDPTRELLGMSATEEARIALRAELGIDASPLRQWINFIRGIFHGDFGYSYFYKEPALDIILERLPATIELVLITSIIIIFVGIPAGVYIACNPRSLVSRVMMVVSTLGVSVPVFLTSMLLIYVFSIKLNWFPSFGRGEPETVLWGWKTGFTTWNNISHLILPSVALASVMLPLFVRLTRSDMIEVLASDYITYAKAKGLSWKRIVWRHAFRNTLLPLCTIGGVQLGTMLAFTVLTETVFQWPGVGLMFIEAVNRSDAGLLVAYFLFTALLFIVINTVIDIVYTFIDPTIRIKER